MAIDFEQALEASKTSAVLDLDISMFTPHDMVNFVLQRSEVLRDLPRSGRIVKAWSDGDPKPVWDAVHALGDDLIRRAIGFILLEFEELKPLLAKLPHDRVADIGCGYAVFDFFMAREFGSHVTLIDLESNDLRHFGYKKTGAAYSDLHRTREFFLANGIAERQIKTINPETSDVTELRDFDLAMSFVSCGFHYPWETYETFFRHSVKPGGSIILDIRGRRSARAQRDLAEIGAVKFQQKAAYGSADRFWVNKAA